jgi:hypothetical protein
MMSVRKGQERLKNIAGQISDDKQLSSEDKEFLVTALLEIYNGEDAEVSLGVKAKRGERKSAHVRNTKIIKKYINGLIKALIDSYDDAGKNESQWDRALRQRNKQRRRLSGNIGQEAYMAQKPKGMWWRTYKRLQERAYEAEQRSDDQFIVKARRLVKMG